MSVRTLVFKYLDIPSALGKPFAGRGGSVRFFLLHHEIPFEDVLVSFDDWRASEKARVIETNQSPGGYLPVLVLPGGEELSEHSAIARYVAAANHISNKEGALGDAKQDIVASAQQAWRDAFVKAAFSPSADEKSAFTNELAPKHMAILEALYTKYKSSPADSPFLTTCSTGNKGMWGDALVFGVLHDQQASGLVNPDSYNKYPHLSALFKAYNADANIRGWIAKVSK